MPSIHNFVQPAQRELPAKTVEEYRAWLRERIEWAVDNDILARDYGARWMKAMGVTEPDPLPPPPPPLPDRPNREDYAAVRANLVDIWRRNALDQLPVEIFHGRAEIFHGRETRVEVPDPNNPIFERRTVRRTFDRYMRPVPRWNWQWFPGHDPGIGGRGCCTAPMLQMGLAIIPPKDWMEQYHIGPADIGLELWNAMYRLTAGYFGAGMQRHPDGRLKG